jgi:transcriptional regulator with XRE-family HTH domain
MFHLLLRDLRRSKRLTQSDLAAVLGTSTSAVGNWELGLREPDFQMLQRIAEYFHVSTDYLLGLTKEKAPAGDPAEASAPTREQMIDTIIQIYRTMSDAEKLDFLARLNTPAAP